METTETTTEEVAADAQAVAKEAEQVAQREQEKEETISLEEARKLRSEAKNLRERTKAAESRLEKMDAEKLSETEKLQKQVEETSARADAREGRLKTIMLQSAVEQLKNEFGVRAPRSMAKLIDLDNLEFDLDKGEVLGVETELKRLRKDDPDLFIKGGTDGGKGGGGRPETGVDMNAMIRGKAGR